MTDFASWASPDRLTIAYLLLTGLVGTLAVATVRVVRASRLEARRRAGSGPRAQFERGRRRR